MAGGCFHGCAQLVGVGTFGWLARDCLLVRGRTGVDWRERFGVGRFGGWAFSMEFLLWLVCGGFGGWLIVWFKHWLAGGRGGLWRGVLAWGVFVGAIGEWEFLTWRGSGEDWFLAVGGLVLCARSSFGWLLSCCGFWCGGELACFVLAWSWCVSCSRVM